MKTAISSEVNDAYLPGYSLLIFDGNLWEKNFTKIIPPKIMPMAPQIENIKFETLLKGIIDAKAEAKIVIPVTTIRVL